MNAFRLAAMFAALSLLAACGGAEIADDEGAELAGADDALTSKGKFEVFTGADGQRYFHLLAGNGEKILASEGYSSASAVTSAINSVKANGVDASHFQLREALDGSNYFVLVATNGQIIGASEMYASKSNAQRGIDSVVKVVQATASQATPPASGARFETFKGLDGKYYFHVRAANGEIVLQSQGYSSSSSAKGGVDSVTNNGVINARYELRAAADGRVYFVLRAANNAVIGRSQMYTTTSGAKAGQQACANVIGSISGRDVR